MAYAVKEIFYTLQGEGANAGRPAVFCRFAGCNLWSGREQDRATAVCRFCDTDFVGTDGTGGGKFADADALADAVAAQWPPERGDASATASGGDSGADSGAGRGSEARRTYRRKADGLSRMQSANTRFVVLTGGEPALQLDTALIDALHARGFAIAIETNGTLDLPPGIDWVCVSPKADTLLRVVKGQELKLVYPQPLAMPERFEELDFEHFLLQPMDGLPGDTEARARHTQQVLEYCLRHPRWRLSLQTHKLLGIP